MTIIQYNNAPDITDFYTLCFITNGTNGKLAKCVAWNKVAVPFKDDEMRNWYREDSLSRTPWFTQLKVQLDFE